MFLTWCEKSTRNSFKTKNEEWNEQWIYIFPRIIRVGNFMYRSPPSVEMFQEEIPLKVEQWTSWMFTAGINRCFYFTSFHLIQSTIRVAQGFVAASQIFLIFCTCVDWRVFLFELIMNSKVNFIKEKWAKKFSIHQTHFISTASE